MCGRYFTDVEREELQRILEEVQRMVGGSAEVAAMRTGEIRPTDIAPVYTATADVAPAVALMRWGFPGIINRQKPNVKPTPIINARSETIAEKPTFSPYLGQRCLIPATSYFEWASMEGEKKKLKMEFQPTSNELFYMAGIFRHVEGSTLPVFTIITTKANSFVSPIHDRMPVILWEKAARRAWMAGETNLPALFRDTGQELRSRIAA